MFTCLLVFFYITILMQLAHSHQLGNWIDYSTQFEIFLRLGNIYKIIAQLSSGTLHPVWNEVIEVWNNKKYKMREVICSSPSYHLRTRSWITLLDLLFKDQKFCHSITLINFNHEEICTRQIWRVIRYFSHNQ